MQRLNADANGVRRRPLVVGWQLTAEIGLLIKLVASRCGFRSLEYRASVLPAGPRRLFFGRKSGLGSEV